MTPGRPSRRLRGALLHPHVIVRVAGEPAVELEAIDSGRTAALLAAEQRLIAQIGADAAGPIAALERLIPDLADKQVCASALSVKRDLYRIRPLKAADLQRLELALDPAFFQAIQTVAHKIDGLACSRADIETSYDDELEQGQAALHRLSGASNLGHALAYSNPLLYSELASRFWAGTPMRPKEQRALEDVLLQYMARSSAKISPLSSFTTVQVGPWSDADSEGALDLSGPLVRRLEYKSALIRHIVQPLLDHYAFVKRAFPLQLNGSLREIEGRLRVRKMAVGAVSGGRFWGTGEAFAHLDPNALIKCLAHVFETSTRDSLPVDEIVASVCALAPRLTPDAVHPFLEKLYGLQLLRADTGFADQDDVLQWARRIGEALAADPRGPEFRLIVDGLETALSRFAEAPPLVRTDLVGEIRDLVRQLRDLTGAEPHEGLERSAFFENCYVRPRDSIVSPARLEPFADDLDLILQIAPLVDNVHYTHSLLADHFLSRFGDDGRCEDVETFLEEFDDLYRPGTIDFQPDAPRVAEPSATTSALRRVQAVLQNYIASLLRSEEKEVELDPQHLRRILAMAPPCVRRRGASYSFLAQFALDQGRDNLVLNQAYGGRSTLMSRFLEAVDDAGVAEVRAYLDASTEGGKHAEVPGVFGFNANRHPRLSHIELALPPFPQGHPGGERMALEDLSLRYDASTHEVYFTTADGTRLAVWYQGFLLPALLPQRHRLLALLFREGPINFTLDAIINNGLVRFASNAVRMPRLRLGGLVLARQQWIEPLAEAPCVNLPPRDYYLAIQTWRQKQGLPARVFVRSLPLPDDGNIELTNLKWDEFNFKDLKPFYVDLEGPRSVRLMQRMLKRNRFTLSMTELLPVLDDTRVQIEGRGHVSEFQFETTLPPHEVRLPDEDWFTIRAAYFEQDRRRLILEAVDPVLEKIRSQFGVTEAFYQVHWRHGPHVDVTVRCAPDLFHGAVAPVVLADIREWLQANPSQTTLNEGEYDKLSRAIGASELEPGPYLPLLRNNTAEVVPYSPSRTLKIPEVAESKAVFLSDTRRLMTRLLQRRDSGDDLLIVLAAMMAAAGDTFDPNGLARGYISYRSHAEYFFASYDVEGRLKGRFDLLDARLSDRLDDAVLAVIDRTMSDIPLDQDGRHLIEEWLGVVETTSRRNRAIVREHYDRLVDDSTFADLSEKIAPTVDAEIAARFNNRAPSEVSEAFASEHGLAVQRSPQFIAYRNTINFFYFLLPALGVSPTQKFCMCHLVAKSVERVLGVDHRHILGLEPVA